uniref:Reverse transcriptase zinc-binding domain-containing protein n=1 Tax=Aegilops tauschii subsp. strangulata TaxID=200361 RepID=A0A453QAZ2_AEGTS
AKSCYLALYAGSTSDPFWRLTWKCWAPLRVKIFTWLADLDRCWTAARLARHGLPHNDRCVLCDQAEETM